MKICQDLVIYKKAVAGISLILCFFHLYIGINFLIKDRVINESLPLEGSFNSQLAFIHLLLLILLVGYALLMAFETLISKTMALLSSIFIALVYFGWYYEKFAYLEPKGTLEYNQQISEIGLFQEATTLDYWVLAITMLLIIYATSRFFCGIYTTRYFVNEIK